MGSERAAGRPPFRFGQEATIKTQGSASDDTVELRRGEATRAMPTATSAPAHAGGAQPPSRDAGGMRGPGVAEDVPQLCDGVELLGEYEGSGFKEPRYLIRRSDGQLVQVTHLLHLIAEEIDGSSTYDAIAERVAERYGRGVSGDNVKQLVESSLRRDGIVAGADGAQPELHKPDPLLGLKMKATILPEGAVNLLATLLRPLFWPPVILAALVALVAVDVWYFAVHGLAQSMRGLLYQPLTVLLVYGLIILSVGFHELGHAAACRYGGARPGKIGFGIYVVWPAFYTDVTDALRLGKWGRVRTDLGGIYFNGLFALATAGVYFLTRFEPLLVLILVQHLLALYQFMPFMRLDGYHVISDITGIPDLFARIKPTLRSMKPGNEGERVVDELKPWARRVVRIWVLTVIPVLLFLFGNMVLAAPRILATAWDSLGQQWSTASSAMDDGNVAKAGLGGLQSMMIVLPILGMGVTLARVAKRTVSGYVNLARRRPVVGVLVGAAGSLLIAGAIYVLIPNGEYEPIGPEERWTVGDSVSAFTEVTEGRPSYTEEQEMSGTSAEDPGTSDDGTVTPFEEDTTEDDTTEETTEEEEAVEPTPEPTEDLATEEATPAPTTSP